MTGLKNGMRVVIFAVCLALAGLLVAGSESSAQVKEKHPHIRAALKELKEGAKELKEADHDFGGHRADALEAVDKAIGQLEICLKFEKK